MFALLLLCCLGQCEEPNREDSLPLVEDWMDEIALVYNSEHPDWFPALVFVRDGMRMDTRSHDGSMLLLVVDGEFALQWTDWNCRRVVHATRVGIYDIVPPDVDCGPWWGMANNMRALRAP